jgi:hypothetical protein
MPGRECYHCKQWIDEGEAHDCWTTTEAALIADLSEDLRDAWERLRDAMVELGEQRIYASGSCIMFSRTACYFFVRPRRSFLELCVFLSRALKAPQIRRVVRSSRLKVAHTVQVRHRDEVEAPLTDWLREAYDVSETLTARGRAATASAGARVKGARPAVRPASGAQARTAGRQRAGRRGVRRTKPAQRKR